MLNIPESIKTLFKTDGVFKNFRVHFPNGEHADLTNSDIVSESVKFTESICSKEVFQFGLSERSQIEFECVNMPNIYGVTIECGIEIDTSSLSASEIADIQGGTYDGSLVLESDSDLNFGYYHIPYGVFIVQSCPRSHGAMYRRRVTAYSFNTGIVYPLTSFLNQPMPFDELTISSESLLALTAQNMDGLSESTINMDDISSGGAQYLYNSSGTYYQVTVDGIEYKYCMFDLIAYDFARFDFDVNKTAMDAVGVAVASAVQAIAGNLIYNKEKTQIYDNTEKALRRKMPYLFAPSVWASVTRFDGLAKTGVMDFGYELESGQVIPLPSNGNYGISETDYRMTYYAHIPVSIPSSVTVSVYSGSVTSPTLVGTRTVTVEPATFTFTGAKAYRQTAQSAIQMNFKSTLEIENYYHISGITPTSADAVLKGYTFSNAFSVLNAVNGVYEINGAFGKINRENAVELLHLGQQNDFAFSLSDYSECWWDDYAIEPIGAVEYQFNDGQDTSYYSFGTGSSVYYMDDNLFLKSLNNPTTAEIETILDTYFVPQAVQIDFIPFELDCIGLPFLEAGDRVSVDIGTGETIESYIMTHTISGIQMLTDSITCKGGEASKNGS